MNQFLSPKSILACAALTLSTTAAAIPQPVSSGLSHSLFLDATGNVYVAGICVQTNACGPLNSAEEPTKEFLSPTYAQFQNATAVFAGYDTSAILDENGDLYYAGTWSAISPNPTMEWTKVAAPGKVLDAAWTAYKKLYFLVESGSYTVNDVSYPQSTLYSLNLKTGELVQEGAKTDWIQLSGSWAIGALDKFGDAYIWGGNKPAMYGNDATEVNTEIPAQPTVAGMRFRKLTLGTDFAIGLTADDVPYTWGSKAGGAAASAVPVTIPGLDKVNDAVASGISSQFIDTDGRLLVAGFHNLRTFMGQAMRGLPGSTLTIPYTDTTYTTPYTPTRLINGFQDTVFFYDASGLRGYSANQYGEMGVNSETPEFHYITQAAPFVGTPVGFEETASASTKGNASYNNGKGGNYPKTGHEDNGKGEARNKTKFTSNKAFTARTDGRGFKRSN